MKTIDVRQKRGSAKELALTPNERNKLYGLLTDPIDRIIFLTGCFAGLRTGEMCQMRFEWLEWYEFEGNRILKIVIPDKCQDARNAHKVWRPKILWKTALYVFDNEIATEIYMWYNMNKKGLQMSRQAILYRVKHHLYKALLKLGAPLERNNLTVHALRSTFVNYIINEYRLPNGEKLDPMFVKTLLRHSDLRTTMAHYKSETIAQQEAYLNGVVRK